MYVTSGSWNGGVCGVSKSYRTLKAATSAARDRCERLSYTINAHHGIIMVATDSDHSDGEGIVKAGFTFNQNDNHRIRRMTKDQIELENSYVGNA